MKISKAQVMEHVRQHHAHEAFTHEILGTFDITLMRDAARRGVYGEVYKAPLVPADVAWLMQNRDWELERVWQIAVDPTAPWDTDPALAILVPVENTHLLCDGIHRILARWLLRMPTFSFYMAPLAQVIRPSTEMMFGVMDWGNIDIRDGKMYYRGTDRLFVGTKPPPR